MRFPGKKGNRSTAVAASILAVALALALSLSAVLLGAGCGGTPTVVTSTATETVPTATAPPYQRQTLTFFRGIDEPRPDAWQDVIGDRAQLRTDGFNIVVLGPPVLITPRSGGQPRIILQGAADSAPGVAEEIHNAGLSVFIAPTTAAQGYNQVVDPSDTTLSHLTDDATSWAQTAEEKQAELFSPLDEYNLALGTDAANKWSAAVLPLVKQKYTGPVVAKVVPDISTAPAPPGAQHDFEKLDYKGYDYLMLDIYPHGEALDEAAFEAQVSEILARANAIAQRDGLKGVLLEFGAWREESGIDSIDGPALGEDNQALVTGAIMKLSMPQIKGFFWHGWTLSGRGARGHKVEDVLRQGFGG
ncbi:MAG: hypothetical protein ACYC6Z_05095 [Thermoleophilia bacterium]